jgi:hypothetical protein
MPTNVFFNHAVDTEQMLMEDLVVESLRMYGHEIFYLPREVAEQEDIFVEDVRSTFGDAYSIEAYIENTEGFEGEGDLFSKFGIEIRDQATFIISLRSWERFVSLDENLASSWRPNEGDLIYFPLSGSMFEIKFVEHENPFYQVGKLFVFKCQCELYEYNQDDFDTGIAGVDDVEASNAYSIKYTMTSGNSTAFVGGEQVKLYGTDTVVGEVQSWDATTSLLYLMNLTGQTITAGSTQFVGEDSGATWTVSAIGDELEMVEDELAQNEEFDTKGNSYLDFSETNPFGEVN